MAHADHTRDPWCVYPHAVPNDSATYRTIFPPSSCDIAHGLSSPTLAVPSPWVRSVVPSGTVSRVRGTHQEYAPAYTIPLLCRLTLSLRHVGRSYGRRPLRHQSPCARNGWQLRCLGRHVLDVRLCGQGLAAKGRHVECHHLRFHDWWMSRCTE